MSTTTNIGLFKHDNPSTNKDIFDVDKALNQNWDKTDKAFGEDRKRLDLLEASNTIYNYKGKVDTLANLQLKTKTQGDVWYCEEDSTYYACNGSEWIPTNLNLKLGIIDELKYKTIKAMQEVETPTPVKGTAIDLTDSAEAKITELKISGNSRQETRKGYNLANISDKAETTVNSGIKYSRSNGEISLDGSASSSGYLFDFEIATVPAGTYLFTKYAYTGGSGSYTLVLDVTNSSGRSKLLDMGNSLNKVPKTYTFDEETTLHLKIWANSGATFSNSILKFQLVEGTEEKECEPYGASPSPDHPSEVECCGDNVNLFDVTQMKQTIPVDTSECIYITVKPNTKYTLSTTLPLAGNNFADMFLMSGHSTAGTTSDNGVWEGNAITITSDSNGYLSILYRRQSTSKWTNLTSYKYKLVEGTEVGEYSPYGQGSVKVIKCNKNLFDGDKNKITTGYYLDNSGNTVVKEGAWYSNDYIKVENNKKYIISNLSVAVIRICFYNKNKKFISRTAVEQKEISFIIPNNCRYIRLSAEKNDYASLQLEKNETKTDYIEHKSQTYTIPTQQPFRAIGDIRDTFILKNNKWYERHCIKRLILDGTENIVYSPTFNLFYTDIITDRKIDFINLVSNNFLNVYTSIDATAYTNMKNGTFTGSDTNRILFKATNYTTVDNFKAWLSELYNAGTPVYIDYVLKVPVDIECTEEQSTVLWDIYYNAKTYDKITHIYSTDNVEPNMEVIYKKDIETLFNNIIVESEV